MQVHILLMTAGHDPVLVRTLREAAMCLSGLHAVHSPLLGPLLPEAVRLGGEDLSLQQQPVRVLGGSLASHNQGVLACRPDRCYQAFTVNKHADLVRFAAL